jgi:quercetin dioxygenase-like cupin family protein
MAIETMPVLAVPAGAGEALWIGTDLTIFKAIAEDTAGQYSFFETVTQPNGGPPMHVHRTYDEAYYVLAGDYEIWHEGKVSARAGAGGFFYVPRGLVHAYRNIATAPGKMVVVITPAGFEGFFREVGIPAQHSDEAPPPVGPSLMARFTAVAPKYDTEIVGPPPR